MSVFHKQGESDTFERRITNLEERVAVVETRMRNCGRWTRRNKHGETTIGGQHMGAHCSQPAPTSSGCPSCIPVAPALLPSRLANVSRPNSLALAPRSCPHHIGGQAHGNGSATCSSMDEVRSNAVLDNLFHHLQSTLFAYNKKGFFQSCGIGCRLNGNRIA